MIGRIKRESGRERQSEDGRMSSCVIGPKEESCFRRSFSVVPRGRLPTYILLTGGKAGG